MSRKSIGKMATKGSVVWSEEEPSSSVVMSYMESYPSVTQEPPGRDVFWARMSGFIPWPSRLCSAYEVKQLCNVKQPPKTGASKSFPVTFLGTRNERGWVTESNLTSFTPGILGNKLDKNKFKRDKDYRAAVVEAMLLTRSKGIDFSEDFEVMLEDAQPELKEYLQQTCPECAGSFLSGPFHVCTFCNDAMVHWHCFRCDDEHVGDKLWVCNGCKKQRKMKENYIINTPSPETSHIESSQEEELESTDDEVVETKKERKARGGGRKRRSASTDHHDQIMPATAPSSSSGRKRNKELQLMAGAEEYVSLPSDGGLDMDAIFGMPQEDEEEEEEDEADDECFICGQDNELLQCDFPQCRRVYHQVCIVKRLPQPLMIDSSDDAYSPYSTHMTDFTWFCPKHYCASCGSLEKTDVSVKSMPLPENLLSYLMQKYADRKMKDNSYLDCLAVKPLKQCATCPFAMCDACEEAAIPAADKSNNATSFFRTKRNTDVCQCQNCTHPSPKIQLAKLLEKAWSKISRSRLSLPFLRPLLPVDSSTTTTTASTTATTDEKNDEQEQKKPLLDLMTILDKIHQCEYSQLKGFQRDLNLLRNQALAKLEQSLQTCVGQDEDVTQLSTYKDLKLSLDTILEAGEQFVDSKRLIFSNIEDIIGGKVVVEQDKDGVEDNQQAEDGPRRGGRKRLSSNGDVEPNGDEASSSNGRGRKVSEQLSNAFWRVECHFDPTEFKLMRCKNKSLKMFSVFKKVEFNKKELVGQRSIQQWAEHVRQGSVPQKYKEGISAASGMNHLAYASTTRSKASFQEKNPLDVKAVIHRLLDQEEFEEALTDELQVAKLMVGMQHNALRETFTLNAHDDHAQAEDMAQQRGGAYRNSLIDGSLQSKVTEHFHSTRIQDESWLMLERLQEMTKQTLEIQARLKQDYLLKQRQIFQTSSEVYSFQDMNILTELKLANDNLRWRLKQRNLLIESKNQSIADLSKQCRAYEERIAELERLQHVNAASTAPPTTLPRIVKTSNHNHENSSTSTSAMLQPRTSSSSASTSQSIELLDENIHSLKMRKRGATEQTLVDHQVPRTRPRRSFPTDSAECMDPKDMPDYLVSFLSEVIKYSE